MPFAVAANPSAVITIKRVVAVTGVVQPAGGSQADDALGYTVRIFDENDDEITPALVNETFSKHSLRQKQTEAVFYIQKCRNASQVRAVDKVPPSHPSIW
ncbi:MAG: hypothetical protein AAGU32_13630 [Bacillota bacterium]